MKRRILVTFALVAATGIGAVVAEALDPGSAPAPFSAPCRVMLRGYEDGSASLFCEGGDRAFGSIDAESGRVNITLPR